MISDRFRMHCFKVLLKENAHNICTQRRCAVVWDEGRRAWLRPLSWQNGFMQWYITQCMWTSVLLSLTFLSIGVTEDWWWIWSLVNTREYVLGTGLLFEGLIIFSKQQQQQKPLMNQSCRSKEIPFSLLFIYRISSWRFSCSSVSLSAIIFFQRTGWWWQWFKTG